MMTVAGAVVYASAAAAAAGAVLALAPSQHSRREGVTCTVEAATASQECAVCLSELAGAAGCSDEPKPAAAVRMLPGCGHGFHEECIGRWLPLRPECPLCRRPVPATLAVVDAPEAEADVAPTWSRPARITCGFGNGRVVWTRSPTMSGSGGFR